MQQPGHILWVLPLCLLAVCAAIALPERHLDLRCVVPDWQAGARGKFAAQFDRREICRIHFPWETSATGDYGEIARTVTIPEGWKPPFWLRWYVSDNYAAIGIERSAVGEGRSAVAMIGHRFKQVLVDGKVVWSRDVADPIFPGARTSPLEPAGGSDPFPPYFRVDITRYVTPGKPFRLALRVFEKVASTQRLPKDWRAEFRFYDKPVEMANTTFSTDVYWADVSLHQGAQPPVANVEPSWRPKLSPVKETQAPPPASQSVPLTLERADLLGDWPFPVSCGLPFPEGAVKEPNLSLTDPDGAAVPVQGHAFLRWPDGTVKWARIDFLARRPKDVAGKWSLAFGSDVRPAPVPDAVRVRRDEKAITVETGALRFVVQLSRVRRGEVPRRVGRGLAGDSLIDSVTLAGRAEPLSTGIGSSMLAGLPTGKRDKSVTDRWVSLKARNEKVEVEAEGPIRATLKLSGRITDGADAVLGRFVTRIEAYAGQPYLRVRHRIFNDYPAPCVRVRTFELQVPVAVLKPAGGKLEEAGQPGIYGTGRPPAGVFAHFGAETATKELSDVEQISLLQADVDRYLLHNIEPAPGGRPQERARGWAAYWGHQGGVAAYVRHFWQQYPQGLAIDNQTTRSLYLRLFAYTAQQPYYTPTQGEAKRLEVWLSFFPDEPAVEAMERFNSLAQRPPRLFSAEWARATGALQAAPSQPQQRFPEVHKACAPAAPWDPERVARDGATGYGLRNWGDSFQPNHWMKAGYGSAWWNNYYDSVFKQMLAYALAGEPSQFEQALLQAQHYMDVDVCHARPGQPDQVGGDYMLSFDHTGMLGTTGTRSSVIGLTFVGLLAADPDILETITLMADRLVAEVKSSGGKLGFRGSAPRCTAFPVTTLMDAYQVAPKPEYLDAAKVLLKRAEQSTDLRRGAQMGCGGPTYFSIGHSEGQRAWAMMALYRATGDPEIAARIVSMAEAEMHEPGGPATWVPWGHLNSEAALFAYAYALTGDDAYLPHAEQSLMSPWPNWMPQHHLEAMYWVEKHLPKP